MQVCLPLLQYFFDVSNDSTTTPLAHSKDGLRELTLPVTPVSRGQANTPSSSKSGRTPRRKSVVFNKEKFPEAFVKQVVLLGLEMLLEILATNTDQVRKSKRLTGKYFCKYCKFQLQIHLVYLCVGLWILSFVICYVDTIFSRQVKETNIAWVITVLHGTRIMKTNLNIPVCASY